MAIELKSCLSSIEGAFSILDLLNMLVLKVKSPNQNYLEVLAAPLSYINH